MNNTSPFDIYALMNEKVVPYGVSLELTARCNLDCIHCYHVRCSGVEMHTDEVKQLLNDLAHLGTMELTLTGGEPFIRSDFAHIISYAVRTTGFSVKLFSNLTLLDESLADELATLPLNTVETTLLGPDDATHDRLTRRSGSFDAVIRSIEMLKARDVPVTAKTVVMKPNEKKLNEMYQLAQKLNIPFRHDVTIFIESNGKRKPLSLQISGRELLRFKKRMEGYTRTFPVSCNAAKSVMSISPDGSVYPCGPFQKPAGNIREMKLEDIWYTSPLMKRVRSIKDKDYRECRACVYFLKCQGCMAMGMGLSFGRKYRCRLARRRLRFLS